MSGSSRDEYQYKKLLDELEGIRGRNTELITVYIPPNFDINVVVSQLREEEGTAENIKSKNTRKNVISALRRIINFLQKYSQKNGSESPENGMAVFSGDVSDKEGKTDIKLYWVEPPEPIESRIYRCDQEFLLEPLKEAIATGEKVGLIVVDSKEATVATLEGKHLNIASSLTSSVWGKHSKGGQSAQRFERLREKALEQFLNRVGELANREFADDEELRVILVGGPGPNKNKFLKGEFLKKDVQDKVEAVYDLGYSSEQGIKELINKAEDVLEDLDVMREKSLVKEFLTGIVSDEALVTYGVEEVRKHLRNGAVETLLVSQEQEITRFKIKCGACGWEDEKVSNDESKIKNGVSQKSCPKCGEDELEILESKDEIKELCEMADQTGADVEFISTETEEGKQFNNAFKGVGALLRFQMS